MNYQYCQISIENLIIICKIEKFKTINEESNKMIYNMRRRDSWVISNYLNWVIENFRFELLTIFRFFNVGFLDFSISFSNVCTVLLDVILFDFLFVIFVNSLLALSLLILIH